MHACTACSMHDTPCTNTHEHADPSLIAMANNRITIIRTLITNIRNLITIIRTLITIIRKRITMNRPSPDSEYPSPDSEYVIRVTLALASGSARDPPLRVRAD